MSQLLQLIVSSHPNKLEVIEGTRLNKNCFKFLKMKKISISDQSPQLKKAIQQDIATYL
jgi:hypothetical protein